MTLPTEHEIRERLTDERLREMRERTHEASRGSWKLWGMAVLADIDGSSNVDTAEHVADPYTPSHQPRRVHTGNGEHIATFDPPMARALIAEILALRQARDDLAQALRLTREYVGAEVLPALDGWEWYEALRKHAPSTLAGMPSGVDEGDESRAQFVEYMRTHGDPDGVSAGAYDAVQQARGTRERVAGPMLGGTLQPPPPPERPQIHRIAPMMNIKREDLLSAQPRAVDIVRAEQMEQAHAQRLDPERGWVDAEPLGMQGWKARSEERFREYGWTRLANFMARWDERGLGK